MRFSLKSLLQVTTLIALFCAVALISYRRGVQDERDSDVEWTCIDEDEFWQEFGPPGVLSIEYEE